MGIVINPDYFYCNFHIVRLNKWEFRQGRDFDMTNDGYSDHSY